MKSKKLNNLVTRALSGAVFVTVVIGSLLLHPYAAAAMMTAVIVWATLEFYKIVSSDKARANRWIGVSCGSAIFAISFFYAKNVVSSDIFIFLIPLMMALFLGKLYTKDQCAFRSIAYTLAGIVYIALPFALCTGMMFPPQENLNFEGRLLIPILSNYDNYLPDILFGFFILLWANDTFAYLTGILIGRHRLFERISPKKSWEGFFGGLIGTAALSYLVAKIFPVLPVFHWAVMAAIIVIFGVYGDLIESLLKRNFEIKDSGRFLPGHGGILDRFDSVFIAAPMTYFYLKIFVF